MYCTARLRTAIRADTAALLNGANAGMPLREVYGRPDLLNVRWPPRHRGRLGYSPDVHRPAGRGRRRTVSRRGWRPAREWCGRITAGALAAGMTHLARIGVRLSSRAEWGGGPCCLDVRMPGDFDEWMDAELQDTPRTLTDNLFHYTNSDAAIFGILTSGTLRLSPFDSNRTTCGSPDQPIPTSQLALRRRGRRRRVRLWDEIDRHIRRKLRRRQDPRRWTATLCPDAVMDRDALRGWGHLSLWAHYGAAHPGVCLRFDRLQIARVIRIVGARQRTKFSWPCRLQDDVLW